MIRVNVPHANTFVDFPDGTSTDVMNRAITQAFPLPQEKSNVVEALGKGVAGSVMNLGAAVLDTAAAISSPIERYMQFMGGVADEAFGTSIAPALAESPRLSKLADEYSQSLGDKSRELFAKDPDVAASLWATFKEQGFKEAFSLAFNPRRLSYEFGQLAPQLISIMIPAFWAGKAAEGLGWGAKGIAAARAVAGGAIGGWQEGAGLYEEVRQKGGSENQKLGALLGGGIATAALNAVGLEGMFAKLPASSVGKVIKVLAGGGVEALTEYLEEPTQAAILKAEGVPTSVIDAWKQGLDVIPSTFLTGVGLSAVLPAATEERKPPPKSTPVPTEGLSPEFLTSEEKAALRAEFNLDEDEGELFTRVIQHMATAITADSGMTPREYYDRVVAGLGREVGQPKAGVRTGELEQTLNAKRMFPHTQATADYGSSPEVQAAASRETEARRPTPQEDVRRRQFLTSRLKFLPYEEAVEWISTHGLLTIYPREQARAMAEEQLQQLHSITSGPAPQGIFIDGSDPNNTGRYLHQRYGATADNPMPATVEEFIEPLLKSGEGITKLSELFPHSAEVRLILRGSQVPAKRGGITGQQRGDLPVRLHHGHVGPFSQREIDLSRAGSGAGGDNWGFWTTESPDEAESYAKNAATRAREMISRGREALLTVTNPREFIEEKLDDVFTEIGDDSFKNDPSVQAAINRALHNIPSRMTTGELGRVFRDLAGDIWAVAHMQRRDLRDETTIEVNLNYYANPGYLLTSRDLAVEELSVPNVRPSVLWSYLNTRNPLDLDRLGHDWDYREEFSARLANARSRLMPGRPFYTTRGVREALQIISRKLMTHMAPLSEASQLTRGDLEAIGSGAQILQDTPQFRAEVEGLMRELGVTSNEWMIDGLFSNSLDLSRVTNQKSARRWINNRINEWNLQPGEFEKLLLEAGYDGATHIGRSNSIRKWIAIDPRTLSTVIHGDTATDYWTGQAIAPLYKEFENELESTFPEDPIVGLYMAGELSTADLIQRLPRAAGLDSYKQLVRERGGDLYSRSPQGERKGSIEGVRSTRSGLVQLFNWDNPKAVGYVIRGFQAADLSTAFHEFFHLFALTATGRFRAALDRAGRKAFGRGIKSWRPEEHEKAAKAFLAYLLSGKSPRKELAPLFDAMRMALSKIYNMNQNTQLFEVQPQLTSAFELMFGGVDTATLMDEITDVILKTGNGVRLLTSRFGFTPEQAKQIVADIKKANRTKEVPEVEEEGTATVLHQTYDEANTAVINEAIRRRAGKSFGKVHTGPVITARDDYVTEFRKALEKGIITQDEFDLYEKLLKCIPNEMFTLPMQMEVGGPLDRDTPLNVHGMLSFLDTEHFPTHANPVYGNLRLFTANSPQTFLHEFGHHTLNSLLSDTEFKEAYAVYRRSAQFEAYTAAINSYNETEAMTPADIGREDKRARLLVDIHTIYKNTFNEWFADTFSQYVMGRSVITQQTQVLFYRVYEQALALLKHYITNVQRLFSPSGALQKEFFDKIFSPEWKAAVPSMYGPHFHDRVAEGLTPIPHGSRRGAIARANNLQMVRQQVLTPAESQLKKILDTMAERRTKDIGARGFEGPLVGRQAYMQAFLRAHQDNVITGDEFETYQALLDLIPEELFKAPTEMRVGTTPPASEGTVLADLGIISMADWTGYKATEPNPVYGYLSIYTANSPVSFLHEFGHHVSFSSLSPSDLNEVWGIYKQSPAYAEYSRVKRLYDQITRAGVGSEDLRNTYKAIAYENSFMEWFADGFSGYILEKATKQQRPGTLLARIYEKSMDLLEHYLGSILGIVQPNNRAFAKFMDKLGSPKWRATLPTQYGPGFNMEVMQRVSPPLGSQDRVGNLISLDQRITKLKREGKGTWEGWYKKGLELLQSPTLLDALLDFHEKGGQLPPSVQVALQQIELLADGMLDEAFANDMMSRLGTAGYDWMKANIDRIVRDRVETASAGGRALNAALFNSLLRKIHDATKAGKLDPKSRIYKLMQDAVAREDVGSLEQLYKAADHPIRSLIQTIFYNSLLSGTRAGTTNIFSNAAWMGYLTAHRASVGFWEGIIRRGRRTRTVGDALGMLRYLITGPFGKEPWQAFAAGWRGDVASGIKGVTKWDEEIGNSARIAAEDFAARFGLRWAARGVSVFSRFMVASDLWFKAIAYDQEQANVARAFSRAKGPAEQAAFKRNLILEEVNHPSRSFGVRDDKLSKQAKAELKRAGVSVSGEITMSDLQKLSAPAYANAFQALYLEAVEMRSARFAEHATFQDAPGAFTQRLMQARNATPFGIGRAVIPFVQTITNLAKRGSELTPGLGILTGKMSHLDAVEICAKQMEGLMIGLLVWGALEAGNITGPPPDDPAERDAFYREGKLPYAVRIGDTWVSYERFDPFGWPVGLMAALWGKWKQLGKDGGDPSKAPQDAIAIVAKLAAVGKDFVVDSTYMQGMAQALGDEYDFTTRLYGTATSVLVPFSGLWRSLRRQYERATTGEAAMRKRTCFTDTFGQALPPGLTEALGIPLAPPRRGAFGEVRGLKGSLFREWIPLDYQEATSDPLEKELEGLKVYPGIPGQVLTVGGIARRMDDEDYAAYVTEYGRKAKDILGRVITSPRYTMARNEAMKQRIIEHTLYRVRNAVQKKYRAKLFREFGRPSVQ